MRIGWNSTATFAVDVTFSACALPVRVGSRYVRSNARQRAVLPLSPQLGRICSADVQTSDDRRAEAK